jgi:hypothetical protein
MNELIKRRRENLKQLANYFYQFSDTYYDIKKQDYLFANPRIERYMAMIESEIIDIAKFLDYQETFLLEKGKKKGDNQ